MVDIPFETERLRSGFGGGDGDERERARNNKSGIALERLDGAMHRRARDRRHALPEPGEVLFVVSAVAEDEARDVQAQASLIDGLTEPAAELLHSLVARKDAVPRVGRRLRGRGMSLAEMGLHHRRLHGGSA
jgi:hypothetical protein